MNYMSSGPGGASGPGGPPRMPLGKMAAPAHLTGLSPRQLAVRAPPPPALLLHQFTASLTRLRVVSFSSFLRFETRSRLRHPPRSVLQRCPTQARPPPRCDYPLSPETRALPLAALRAACAGLSRK